MRKRKPYGQRKVKVGWVSMGRRRREQTRKWRRFFKGSFDSGRIGIYTKVVIHE